MPLPPGTPDLDVLDLLVSVAETGSLGQAARRHGISQPAASMRIRALERRLRLVLLERGPSGSRLTAAGASIVDWAVPVLDAARALVIGAGALLDARSREPLRIAASLTIADHLVPGWLIALRAQRTEVRVALDVANTRSVAATVRDGDADLGFVEGPHPPRGLRSRVIGADELVVVVGQDHSWARRRHPVPLREVATTPLLMREQGSGTRDAISEALAKVCQPAPPAAELGSAAAIKAAAATGAAPAVLSRLMVATEVAEGRLVEVAIAEPEALHRKFRAIWHRDRPPSGPAAALLAIAVKR